MSQTTAVSIQDKDQPVLNDVIDGYAWAAVWPSGIVIATLRPSRYEVYDAALVLYDHPSLIRLHPGYPALGSREAKLRWLRRKGMRVQEVYMQVVEPKRTEGR